MKVLSKWIVLAFLVLLTPIPADAKLPYCGGILHVRTYSGAAAAEAFVVTPFALSGDHLRVRITRKVIAEALKQNPAATIDNSEGIGYQLDGNGATGFQLNVQSADLSTVLSFSDLRPGRHHLRIGLLSPEGEVFDYQDYCFSSPASFSLTDP